jgi:uncharacterized protein (TIGR03435 family)
MIKSILLAAAVALSAQHCHSEDLTKARSFEVASITPCKPGTPANPGEHAGMVQLTAPGGRFRATADSIRYLIEWAYDIQSVQLAGSPDWLGTDHYDIEAKAEGNPTEAEMKLMTQRLLEERFKLKLHHDSKTMTAFVVSPGASGVKLTEPKPGETHMLQVAPKMGPDKRPIGYHAVGTRYTLKQLTDTFARILATPIVDRTGLAGEFDFAFDLNVDEQQPNPMDPNVMIAAMREQLGFQIKSQKTPVDVLVIDNIEKVAAGN